jgi:hypothetical protein
MPSAGGLIPIASRGGDGWGLACLQVRGSRLCRGDPDLKAGRVGFRIRNGAAGSACARRPAAASRRLAFDHSLRAEVGLSCLGLQHEFRFGFAAGFGDRRRGVSATAAAAGTAAFPRTSGRRRFY